MTAPRPLSPAAFAEHLIGIAAALPAGDRRLVAIAGPPGGGKSTLVEEIAAAFRIRFGNTPEPAAILPMDGFHYDDELLTPLGRQARKGAPDTFDVGGLRATLARLAANEEEAVAVPRFDRSIEIARAGARLIHRDTPMVLVEGNYLLFDEAPWDTLADAFHLTAMIKVEETILRERLTARWVEQNLDPAEIVRKVETNDLPNGRHVYSASRPADFAIV